jgi:hypothetical protein
MMFDQDQDLEQDLDQDLEQDLDQSPDLETTEIMGTNLKELIEQEFNSDH